jgi:hypothetical protein
MKRLLSVAAMATFVLVVSFLLGGCQKKSNLGESCTRTQDCEEPLRCVQLECVDCYPACGDGQVCVEGKCLAAPDSPCGKAAICCEKVAEASGNGEAAESCMNLKKSGVPAEACKAALRGFKETAETLTVSCE